MEFPRTSQMLDEISPDTQFAVFYYENKNRRNNRTFDYFLLDRVKFHKDSVEIQYADRVDFRKRRRIEKTEVVDTVELMLRIMESPRW